MSKQQPTIGRIVHFVIPEGPSRGQARPAIVANVAEGERVALHVFVDHVVDDILPVVPFVPSAAPGGPDQPGTWYWPPQVSAQPAAPAYTPPEELVERARVALAAASSLELHKAERFYKTYCSATDGRSEVTGAELPPFGSCSVLVRAGWLSVFRDSLPPEEMGFGS
ncbi:hypothetical protein FJV41_46560 [Myxococcus llanfairpwllgwyngyllgogerychwyrndrobwllllantysiliogogogochensis]|uniref:Uncharacterized protein n=1 Tax=Myxococcus llanfairpwllgwyngyllgogerychwyrndrobwllllantysiliogogogochensis TaxID=2590453 RepID=A0A540WJA9_9BACT|nr:hypothetical protein [Myxococcus llanfairpwllgwyngyllgogerychwyrndrobwllllantysiliogogogochensis]TQF09081.1 hypothetical protein FJV41_46560 [Myxococcus llanfairpwllgwyngyllgogerychwyrndrobwllllantysiliogogogochensis]